LPKNNSDKKGIGNCGEGSLGKQSMVRLNNLYNKISSIENLMLADMRARRGKMKQYGVQRHIKHAETNIPKLHEMMKNKSFKTSEYDTFIITDPKEREISRLPFFPDRIVHHAIMNVLEPVFVRNFTRDTYSCIKGRGIHGAANAVKLALKDAPNTKYCLKLDIRKFYPSIDHEILKKLLRKKFKDAELLQLLDEIIDSAPGLPIGNYLSQYLANFYLSYFDHWIKEAKLEKYYFRYADDIVVLHKDKAHLHALLLEMQNYLKFNLNLEVKHNWQVFPVASRGIDFVGYVFYHSHTRLRKSIKKSFARMIFRRRNRASIESYKSWAKHANCIHLIRKLAA
jgi:RNA-directed DNA polymerase